MIRQIFEAIGLLKKARLSVDEEIAKSRRVILDPASHTGMELRGSILKPRLLTTAEIIKCYGAPGDPDNMITITLPFPFRIAWDKGKTTNRVLVNTKVAPRLLLVLNELVTEYGTEKIVALGIDLFGGLYNFRAQRGLEKRYDAAIKAKNYTLAYTLLSRHSWATAIDLDPERNTLKETSRTARFARSEYKPMIAIFYKHGFISYGVERNNDWMHFEIGVFL